MMGCLPDAILINDIFCLPIYIMVYRRCVYDSGLCVVMVMDYLKIINRYYGEELTPLKEILLIHSRAVARKAVNIALAHPELGADVTFVEEAAMLHDIGILHTHAPGICCMGTEPYIRHGILGAEMLRKEGFDRHALVCERHTGAGISLRDIERQQLPLPHANFLPVSIEEQMICYADKFFSKTRLEEEKTVSQAIRSLSKFGDEGLARFEKWVDMFE